MFKKYRNCCRKQSHIDTELNENEFTVLTDDKKTIKKTLNETTQQITNNGDEETVSKQLELASNCTKEQEDILIQKNSIISKNIENIDANNLEIDNLIITQALTANKLDISEIATQVDINDIKNKPIYDLINIIDVINATSYDDDIKSKSIDSWRLIMKQCEESKIRKSLSNTNLPVRCAWKPIRVFVSSTFTDMHSEREILVKKVFPELREWCEQRKLNLVECDLRWGVPKDSSTGTTICTCLEEIDRCLEENGQPFFINMLSERYGWVPTKAEVPEDVFEKYNWVENVSITHMEILHGAYRMQNENSLFCLRNPDYLIDIAEDKISKFVDTNGLNVLQLKVLKDILINQFSQQVFKYNCSVAGIESSTGKEKVNLIGLEPFAEKVLHFLKERIDAAYPNNNLQQDLTLEEEDEESQKSIMELKSNFVIGRKEETDIILNYLLKGDVNDDTHMILTLDVTDEDKEKIKIECENFGVKETDGRILGLKGVPGIGKTTFLASICRNLSIEGYNVFYHHVSCNQQSINSLNFIQRLLRHLQLEYDSDDDDPEKIMKKIINKLILMPQKLFIILDGMDEFHDCEYANSFSWLPPRFPLNVKVVIGLSCDHFICNSRLQDRDALFLTLDHFTRQSSEEFVNAYLIKYNKKLDKMQLELLMKHKSSGHPLWLSIICEELRMFGEFSTVTKTIGEYPDPLDELAGYVLKRLLREDETLALEKALCLIYCSHSGIPENEMGRLLGNLETGEEAPMATWAAIRRYLKPMLKISKFNRTVKISMNHQLFFKAIKELLLVDEKTLIYWHTFLADFFEKHTQSDVYIFDDLPHNLLQAHLAKRLIEFLRHDVRAIALGRRKSQIIEKIRCTSFIFKTPGFDCESFICNQCSTRSRILSPLSMPTKDLCFLCGEWVPSNIGGVTASFCMQHRVQMAPGWSVCHFCGRRLPKDQMCNMRLCGQCGFKNCCCHLNVD